MLNIHELLFFPWYRRYKQISFVLKKMNLLDKKVLEIHSFWNLILISDEDIDIPISLFDASVWKCQNQSLVRRNKAKYVHCTWNKSIQRIYNTFEKSPPPPSSLSISSSSSSSSCTILLTLIRKKKEFCLVLSLLAMN